MTKRIIVLSDGTGNAAASLWRTNVWRVFELLDLSKRDQVAKYDDGVGNSAFLPLALLGGAFGWGLKRNVIGLYKFVCRNYEPDAQIYAFGFSRGAFTIRVLVALILCEGLAPYKSERDLSARAAAVYRAFRAERFHSFLRIEWLFRKLRDGFLWLTGAARYDRSQNTKVPSVEFLGLWDTVAAYGLPVEEMTRGVSQYIWPLYLPERSLNPLVRRACHALSLDDDRTTFHPVLWTEAGEKPLVPDAEGKSWLRDERISQVWFAGAHANVGGGYPDDALAHQPLLWIMQEAEQKGLTFKSPPKADPNAILKVTSSRDPDGRQYEPRSGLGGYYRYGPRKISDLISTRALGNDAVEIHLPKIHESVFQRIRSDSNAYAPIAIPAAYGVVTEHGEILQGDANPFETPHQAHARAKEQERVWNWVWLRRIVYFLTLAATFHLIAFWWFHTRDVEHEYSSWFRLTSEFVRLIEAFLPRQVARWWADWFASNPGWLLIGLIAVGGLIWLGTRIGDKIRDSMRIIWKGKANQSTIEQSKLGSAVYKFRTSVLYLMTIGFGKRYILPFIAAFFILWIGTVALSHLLFNVVDSFGIFCTETPSENTKQLKPGEKTGEIKFDPGAMCAPTGISVRRGQTYLVTVSVPADDAWFDGNLRTDPSGYATSSVYNIRDQALAFLAVPLRRALFRRWNMLVARVGATGNAEYFLDPQTERNDPNKFSGTMMRTERPGEIFLYVNEAVLPLPWFYKAFYANNKGAGTVVITRQR